MYQKCKNLAAENTFNEVNKWPLIYQNFLTSSFNVFPAYHAYILAYTNTCVHTNAYTTSYCRCGFPKYLIFSNTYYKNIYQ